MSKLHKKASKILEAPCRRSEQIKVNSEQRETGARSVHCSLFVCGRDLKRPYDSLFHSRKKARMVSASAVARPWIIRGLPPPRP